MDRLLRGDEGSLSKFQQRLLSDPYSEEDEAAIARLGI